MGTIIESMKTRAGQSARMSAVGRITSIGSGWVVEPKKEATGGGRNAKTTNGAKVKTSAKKR